MTSSRDLMRLHDGELDPSERDRVEQALARDEGAQSSLSGLEQVGDFVRAASELRAARADAIADRVMAALDERPERRGFRNGALSAAAGALAIAAAAVLLLRAGAPEPQAPLAVLPPSVVLPAPQLQPSAPEGVVPAPADETDSEPSAEIESVDFGGHGGAIFVVSEGGSTTPVVWLVDEPVPGQGRMETL